MPDLEIACTNCGRPYPIQGVPYCCPVCGGLFDLAAPLVFDPKQVERGFCIWRFRHVLGLPGDQMPITLGEGGTPLIWDEVFGRRLAFKCEYLNPSGSFKDRGTSSLVSWLSGRGVTHLVEDSSGNAGASLAAYASRAGMHARIFIPDSASGPKRRQIETYGAQVTVIPGSRSRATEAARNAVTGNSAYASHAWLPFNIPGYATAAYEIHEQLGGEFPGAVVVPAGQGGMLLGLLRGFAALERSGAAGDLPRIVGVQARACAPLWAAFSAGREGMSLVSESRTLAEGVQVRQPLRFEALLREVTASGGLFAAVDEGAILPGQAALAGLGFFVEPTSAIVWDALRQVLPQLPDPVVVILSGSGFKSGYNTPTLDRREPQ